MSKILTTVVDDETEKKIKQIAQDKMWSISQVIKVLITQNINKLQG